MFIKNIVKVNAKKLCEVINTKHAIHKNNYRHSWIYKKKMYILNCIWLLFTLVRNSMRDRTAESIIIEFKNILSKSGIPE